MNAIHPRALLVVLGIVLAAPAAEAQFIGPNPGVILVSPLDPDRKKAQPRKTGEQRRNERLTAQRLELLKSIRKVQGRAADAAELAKKSTDLGQQHRRLKAAVRRAESARRRLDDLREKYKTDATFKIEADRLAFAVRKDLSAYKRTLGQVERIRDRIEASRRDRAKAVLAERAAEAKRKAAPTPPKKKKKKAPAASRPTKARRD